MHWQNISYGYAITNVGRMSIPTDYGRYRPEGIYGPFVYSDVNEKTIGVITVGDNVTFLMSYNETIVTPHPAEQIRDRIAQGIANSCHCVYTCKRTYEFNSHRTTPAGTIRHIEETEEPWLWARMWN